MGMGKTMRAHGRTAALVVWLLAAGLATAAGGEKGKEEGFQHPVLRVPKLETPPTLDGKVEAAEWSRAAAFTGLAAVAGVGNNTMVPEVQQAWWYVGYDDKYLYFGMHSPHVKGTYPKARTKEDESFGVLFEDHVEIQITPHPRDKAGRQGYGFYKVMVNPKEAMVDWHYFNGTIGTEQLWTTGGETKCTVTDEYWDLEVSIELARMQIKKLDGRDLVIQLVRTDSCAGIYFAGWVPCAWMSWDRFPRVDFDPQAPTFQLRRVGEVMEGKLNTEVALVGNGTEPLQVSVEVAIDDGAGKRLYGEKKAVAVKPGEEATARFVQDGLPVSPGENIRNHYEIKATYKEGGKTRLLYHNRLPFLKLNDHFREKYLDPWLAGRPQSGEWEYNIAYMPYSGKCKVGVDLDFFGMAKAVLASKRLSVEVRPKDGAALGKAEYPIEELRAGGLMELPELQEGKYEAVFRLHDGAGKVVSEKTASFVRKRFAWEHNTLGIREDVVVPPFTPVVVTEEKNGAVRLSTWGGAYRLTGAGGGLPASITARMPTGNAGRPTELLAAPVRLEAVADGRPIAVSNGSVKTTETKPVHAKVAGEQALGSVTAAVDATCEFDRWYRVDLTLTPQGTPTLDHLDLLIDLDGNREPVDTLYVQRMGDGRYGNLFSSIPAEPGIHFKSTDLLRFKQRGKDWLSFVPRTYVGNGDRGLWFFAWDDHGWALTEQDAAVTVERLEDGNVRLRVRLLAGPVTLATPRVLSFALQAVPVKANDPRYRTILSEDVISHDTRGYRYWGESVDSFSLPTEEDFEKLRDLIAYGKFATPEAQKQYWWFRRYTDATQRGARLMMYGSTWMTGAGAEEFKTFGGEWLRKSNWKPRPDASYTRRPNYSGSVVWDTPEKLMPTGVNWTRSMNDWFVYEHDKLIDRCGFNGTWWDNSSIGTIAEYDPARGAMANTWNTLQRRELCKRLNYVGYQHVRIPCWSMNMHVDFSFNQVFWMVENNWYFDAPDMTSLQNWDLGEFRAMARTKSTMLIPKPWLKGQDGTTERNKERVLRSTTAMCLSHDIPTTYTGDLNRKLQYELDYADTGACLFSGYWRLRGQLEVEDEHMLVSLYRNERRRAYALVFFNAGTGRARQDRFVGGTRFDPYRFMGRARPPVETITSITDLETGEPVGYAYRDGKFEITDPVKVPWHEYRVLLVKGE